MLRGTKTVYQYLQTFKFKEGYMIQKYIKPLAVALLLSVLPLTISSVIAADATDTKYKRLHQGTKWTPYDWNSFYSQDQGSFIIPYTWIVALKEANGQSFLRDSLARYGYLPNPKSSRNPKGLPVGFLVANAPTPQFSMTCAACHTRQITVNNVNYRVDGGPAFSDMYNFMKDLDQAVGYTLSNQQAFIDFQKAVQAQKPASVTRDQLAAWYLPYNTLISNSLTPTTAPWGVGRSDALALIENQGSGLDIGDSLNAYLIPQNIYSADIPVRYPFLWNAGKQDLTQWAGTSVNGNASYALERNAAEAIGVYGVLYPRANPSMTNGYDFLKVNSLNYSGLLNAEKLINKMGPPKWPWPIDRKKANRGKLLYVATCGPGCHEIKKGEPRPPVTNTWKTPVINVGTDAGYYDVLGQKTVTSGLLGGFTNPLDFTKIIPTTDVASISLVGILNQSALLQKYPNINLSLRAPVSTTGAFESKVLQGIWAAAPYLHNGSVPSLAELLKPAASRVQSFQVGREYDIVNVGLATQQTIEPTSLRVTTDCSDLNSGNSNCGHEFGTNLSPTEKDDLLEYLKTL